MGIGAVTFDLDDTLAVVDCPRDRLLEESATSVGAPPLDRAAYLEAHESIWASETREPIFELLLDDAGVTDIDPAALAKAYRQHIGRHLRPIDGVEAMLDDIADMVPIGLITNGPERAQLDKLERLGWLDRFDAVVITGRLGVPKPQPAPFQAACKRLGVEPSELVHVGDHLVHDVRGAHGVGARAIHVTDAPTGGASSATTIRRSELPVALPGLTRPVTP